MLHGGSGSWSHWIRNVIPLSKHYAVLAPDIPGMGESDMPSGDGTSYDIASAVTAGLEEIRDERRCHALVGFSFGATIAGRVAEQCRRQIGRLVLAGPSGLGIPRPPLKEEMRSWRKLATRDEVIAAHRHNLAVQMFHDGKKIDQLSIRLQDENTRNARLNSRPIARSAELSDALASTDAPISAIWGEEDATARGTLGDCEALLRRFDPDMEMTVLPGVGHFVQYEAADEFNRILLGLLANPRSR